MVATVVFILAFVLIAVTVFFLAMGGGARGAREQLHSQGRGSRRAIGISLFVVILAFAVAVPALVFAINRTTQSKQAPGGLKLTAAQEHGRKEFATYCASCHTLRAANAVGKVGPDLDVLRPPPGLVLNAIAYGRARGNGAMPAQLLQGQDAKDVANFIAVAAGR